MLITPLILAAGEGSRLGGPKALARLHGASLLSHVARLYSAVGVRECIVVSGAKADLVELEVEALGGLRLVHNPNWQTGMLSSILTGLEVAERNGASAVLLHPVDHPLVHPATVRSVLCALADGAPIAVPAHRGRRGHPAGFGRAVWPDLRSADEKVGARAVLTLDPSRVRHLASGVDCLWGVNTPDDLAALEALRP